MKRAHEMPFGAAMRAGGGVGFRLWAPAAKSVAVHCDDRDTPALRGDSGWWSVTDAAARAGSRYQFRIDDELLVPDPASRSNPEGPHGPSVVVDPAAFDWRDEGWRGRPWSETVLYELHVGSFTPEGTFAAARERLPHLASLGVTAVELMPVADFPGRFGWGYDGVLPFAPHHAYGTPDDLKAFVQDAHRLGLMVFLDVVYNHFGPDGNYLGRFAPQFFSKEHQSPWGAAINFDGEGSSAVREFFIHNALYWIGEFHFDGLRLDAVHAIVDDSKPDVLEELSTRVRAAAPDRHVHLVLENEKNQHDRLAPRPRAGFYDAQWNDDFHHVMHVLLTGETQGYYVDYGQEPMELLARSLTDGFIFAESERRAGGARIDARPAPAQPLGAMVHFVSNHDQVGNRAFGERLETLAPPGAFELALLLTLLTPATPMLFFGDELAARTPFLYFANWEGELRDAVREGRKREFSHASIDAEGNPIALPDPCGAASFEAGAMPWHEAQGQAAIARLALVRRALETRAEWIAPRADLLLPRGHVARRIGATGLQVTWRYESGDALRLDMNLGGAAVDASTAEPAWPDARLLFAHGGSMDASWPAWSAAWFAQEARA